MAQPQITLGYWNFRGIAQPIKYVLEYLSLAYVDKKYSHEEESLWFDVEKRNLQTIFPNLPYLKDGDFELTESEAILEYLCLKAGRPEMAQRSNPKEQGRFTEARGVVQDLRSDLYNLCYSSSFETEKAGVFSMRIHPRLDRLNKALEKSEHVVGTISWIDFVLFEIISVIGLMDSTQLEKYENLKRHHAQIAALPAIATYLTSWRYNPRPVNNPVLAKWA